VEVVASLSQGRTAAAQCGLFTHKSVPVIFEPPCNTNLRCSFFSYISELKIRPCRKFEILFFHFRKPLKHNLPQRTSGLAKKSSIFYGNWNAFAWQNCRLTQNVLECKRNNAVSYNPILVISLDLQMPALLAA